MSYCQTYNKSVIKGHGTLIGNWLEEEILRDASGHTHLESSRHLDTFMRVMGDRPYPVSETFVTSSGRRSRPPSESNDKLPKPKDTSAASRRMQELAAHARESCMFRAEAINALALEKALKERNEKRACLEADARAEAEQAAAESESSANYKFRIPGGSEAARQTPEEKADCYFKRLLNAPAVEGGELVSRWTELASGQSSSVQQTPHLGRMMFGKSSFFSLPTHYSLQGLCKDTEALGLLEKSLQHKKEPNTTASQASLPALQAFKQRLRDAIRKSKGCLGFLILKAVLKELADDRGLVCADSVEHFLWDAFDVRSSGIPIEHLRSALKILTLVDKTSIRAADFVEFTWAPLAPCRNNILTAFQRAAGTPQDISAAGSDAPTVRINRSRRPQVRLCSIPDFLHDFLPQCPREGADSSGEKAVPLPHVLEALADLSQGVLDDESFLAVVSEVATKEGLQLVQA